MKKQSLLKTKKMISLWCLLFVFLLQIQSAVAQNSERSCIKAWVNGSQLLGITSTNPITYSRDYCIDSNNAIGYVSSPSYHPEDLVISFWSLVPIDQVNNLSVLESDCSFYYEYPAQSYWGTFSGGNDGYINFYFAQTSSTMAYGTARVDFQITDQNGNTAIPSGGHLCYPSSFLMGDCSKPNSFLSLAASSSIVLYGKEKEKLAFMDF